MRFYGAVCLGFIISTIFVACEPPAKVTSPASASSVAMKSSAKPLVTTSAAPSAAVMAPAPSALVSAAAAKPAPTPCPPEVPAPAGALAWVSGCKILQAEKIYFDLEKDRIKKQSFAVLDAIGDVLATNPDLFVEIQGHLGERRDSYGRKLSELRAKAVLKYLVAQKGIEANRLEAQGYEDSVPIADWKTEEGRAQNRRIDFVIWKWRGGTSRVMWPGP